MTNLKNLEKIEETPEEPEIYEIINGIINCPCGSNIKPQCYKYHIQSKKHRNYFKSDIKYICECGVEITPVVKSRHLKTKKHKLGMEYPDFYNKDFIFNCCDWNFTSRINLYKHWRTKKHKKNELNKFIEE